MPICQKPQTKLIEKADYKHGRENTFSQTEGKTDVATEANVLSVK